MNPGDTKSMSMEGLLSLDDRAPLDPAESATHDETFCAQQQKIQRLNQYYDDVVAELRALLDQDHDEAG